MYNRDKNNYGSLLASARANQYESRIKILAKLYKKCVKTIRIFYYVRIRI